MAQSTPIIVFGSQGPAFLEQLDKLLELSRTQPTLYSFFSLALEAILAEFNTLSADQLVDLPPISAFSSVAALSKYHAQNDYTNPTANGVLLCLMQMAQYISASVSGQGDKLSSPNARLLGFCTGLISAVAMREDTDNIAAKLQRGVESVRLVFWVSFRSQQARKIIQKDDPEEGGAWSIVVVACDFGKTESFVTSFNKKLELPDHRRVSITAVSAGSVTVSGWPPVLQTFADWLDSEGGGLRTSPLKLFSPYHTQLLESSLNELMEDVDRRAINLVQGEAKARPVYDTISGQPLDVQDTTELVRRVVASNLVEPARWDLLVTTLVADKTLIEGGKQVEIISIGHGFGLCSSLSTSLQHGPLSLSAADIALTDLAALSSQQVSQAGATPHVQSWTGGNAVNGEEIAIVSMACRFPGNASTPEKLWQLLETGRSTAAEIPRHLFGINDYYGDGKNRTRVRHMHALSAEDVSEFDCRLYNMSPKEAAQMDPQHRLTMLCCYEALEKAGYVPGATSSFDRKRIACFMGAAIDDYRENASSEISSYFITGNIRAFIPGHVSFHFQWEGPSNSIDTGESSSIVAIEHARNALLAGQCDVALAGGVTVITSPQLFIGMDRDGLLSHQGANRTFDANNDGACRGDGAGVLLLKRLSDAIVEGDNILGTIPGTACGTLPGDDAHGQEAVLAKALEEAGLLPSQISHIEASGYHSAEGEAQELEAISAVFGRTSRSPITVGSVKPNIGASEAASGIASIIKAILMLQHGAVPRHIGIQSEMNPRISKVCADGRIVIPTKAHVLSMPPAATQPAILVNSVTLSHGQAALIVKAPPAILLAEAEKDLRGAHLFMISAKTTNSLEASRKRLVDWLKYAEVDMSDLSYTLTARRIHYPFRVAVVANDQDELIRELRQASVIEACTSEKGKNALAFYFGSTIPAESVRRILKAEPAVAAIFEMCRERTIAMGFPDFANVDVSDHAARTFTIQYSLSLIMQSWDLEAASIAGQRIGSITALALTGVLNLDEALYLANLSMISHETLNIALARLRDRSVAVPIIMASSGQVIPAEALSLASLQIMQQEVANTSSPAGIWAASESYRWICFGFQDQHSSFAGPAHFLFDVNRDTWRSIAQTLAALHLTGCEPDYTAFHRSFLPGLRVVHNLPTYSFDMTRFWIEYKDRNLIRGANDDDDDSGVEFGSTGSDNGASSLLPPVYPLLSKCTEEPNSEGVGCATYETLLHSSPSVELVQGHLVNHTGLVPATMWAEMALEVAHDLFARLHGSNEKEPLFEIRNLSIVHPLTLAQEADGQSIVVSVTGDYENMLLEISFASRTGGKVQQHLTCGVVASDGDEWRSDWRRVQMLVSTRRKALTETADVLGPRLTYKNFERVVEYEERYRGMRSVALSRATNEAATVVRLSPEAPRSNFVVNPCLMDSLGQITGFICNVSAPPGTVMIANSVEAMRYSPEFQQLASVGGPFHAYSHMSAEGDSGIMTGDAYFMDAATDKIIGMMQGVRYKRVPLQVLNLLLPGPAGASAKPTKQVVDSLVPATAASKSVKPEKQRVAKKKVSEQSMTSGLMTTILSTIAVELGIAETELIGSAKFSDLGLDSLMAIVILGGLQPGISFPLPPSLFLDCATPDELAEFVAEQLGEDPQADMGSVADGIAEDDALSEASAAESAEVFNSSGRAADALTKTTAILLTELGVDASVLTDDAELADLGLDSLMTLLVLGALKNEIDCELPASLFMDCPTLKDVRQFFVQAFGEDVPQLKSPTPPAPKAPAQPVPQPVASTVSSLSSSIKMNAPTPLQTIKDGSNKRPLFLCPDGSGSAAVYGGLPSLGRPVFGVNSPFLSEPADWTVEDLAALYLKSIKMAQPEGPYMIGGWSFGGIVSYHIARLLEASDDPKDRMSLLLLLDSPCPVNLPPLPASIVSWIFETDAFKDIAPPKLTPRLSAHFKATVDALSLYKPRALVSGCPKGPAHVTMITAQDGLGGDPKDVQEMNDTVLWLMKSRAGLGAHGWQVLVGEGVVQVKELNANHFSMMHKPWILDLGKKISEACDAADS